MKNRKIKTAGIVLAAILAASSASGTSVWASEMTDDQDYELQTASSSSDVVVTTEQELIDAVDASSEDPESRTKIILTRDIAVSQKLVIPENRYIELCGDQSGRRLSTKKKYSDSTLNPAGVILVQGDLSVHDLEISGSNLMRTVAVYDGVLTLDDGAVITGGKITEHMNGSGIYISDNTQTKKKAALTINEGASVCNNTFQPTQQAASVSMEGIGVYADQAVVVMNGGTISGNQDNTSPQRRERTATGGAVAINGSLASFVMNGGSIEDNTVKGNGGAFYTSNGASVVINDGTIRNNMCYGVGGAFYLTSSLTDNYNLQINGGIISKNIADATNSAPDTDHSLIGSGGAVYVTSNAKMEMTGGVIQYNQAIALPVSDTNGFDGGQGGAVYAAGTVDISGGTITENTATAAKTDGYKTGNGGGIAVSGGAEPGTVRISGGVIQNNSASMKGADIYINADKSSSNLMSSTVYTILKTEGQGTLQIKDSPVIGNLYLPAGTEFYLTGGISDARISVESETKENGCIIARGDGYSVFADDARNLTNEEGKKVYNLENGKVVLSGEGSYTDLSDATVGIIADQMYSGSEITPEPEVVFDGERLTAGVDFQYSYRNNINAGKAEVTISGAGGYSGKIETDFVILPKDLNEISIGEMLGYPYFGEAVIPELNLSYEGTQLEKDTDYQMVCRNNDRVGTAVADVTGIGNYTGSVSLPFDILSPDEITICGDEESLNKAITDAEGTAEDPSEIYISGAITLTSTLLIPDEKHIVLIGADGTSGLLGKVLSGEENEADDPLVPATAGISKTSMIRVKGSLSVVRMTLSPAAYNSAEKVRQRVFRVDEGGMLVLNERCTVSGGYGYVGAGLLNQGTVEINGASFTGNRLTAMTNGLGGAIANDKTGILRITTGIFEDNLSRKGAVVYNAEGAQTIISGGVFRENKASFDQGSSVVLTGEGAALYNDNDSTMEITGGVFSGNEADDFGGAIANYGTAEISGGEFSGNTAGKKGAGIYTAGETVLNDGLIRNNSISSDSISFEMADGGGVYVAKGIFTMNGGTITENTVRSTYNSLESYSNAGNGGGVYVSNHEDGSVFIMHGGTISKNTARSYLKKPVMGHGGGVYVAGGSGKAADRICTPGTFEMDGGMITDNTASGTGDGVYASSACSYNYEEDAKTYSGTREGLAVLSIAGAAVIDNNTADNLYLESGIVVNMSEALTGKLSLTAEKDADATVFTGGDYQLSQSDADRIKNENGVRTVTLDAEKNEIYLRAEHIEKLYQIITDEKTFVYTGQDVCPDIRVTEKDNTEHVLTEGEDYTVTYTDIDGVSHTTDATEDTGEPYVITVTGCGEYAGSLTKNYTVQPASIYLADVNLPDQVYTGRYIKYYPELKDIRYSGQGLSRNRDYYIATSSFRHNLNVGMASFQIVGNRDYTGEGNYYGTRTVRFRILFKDVESGHQFYDPIYWAFDQGILSGWDDGTYRPWNTCNRAAVVTFLWRLSGCPEPSKIAAFSDMPADTSANQDFRKAISWASEQKIVTGYSDNTFRPWADCNRAAVVTFIWRYAGKPSASTSKFTDKTGNADFDTAIAWASENGIANGYDENTFGPWKKCNRAAVASFLYRYKND